jgi:hypothetical protein
MFYPNSLSLSLSLSLSRARAHTQTLTCVCLGLAIRVVVSTHRVSVSTRLANLVKKCHYRVINMS